MLRLELDDLSVDLDDLELLHVTEVDWGFPEVRETSDPRPEAHGVFDNTQWFGARVISVTGKVAIDWDHTGGRAALADALNPFLRPGARPFLYRQRDDGRVVRIAVRADQFSNPEVANVEDFALSWKSPTGIFESGQAASAVLVPEVAVLGRRYNLVFNRVYPEGWGTMMQVTNEGALPTSWSAKIYGPCTGPEIQNVTLGQQVSLDRLSLGLGEFVEVDSRDHTVLADGLPDNSRWGSVDFARTDWWPLPAGTSWLRMRCATFDPPARTVFSWRHAYLL
jgi:hypothetical protein